MKSVFKFCTPAFLLVATSLRLAANDTGVWASDSAGELRLLFREGDTVSGKIVKGFSLLKPVVGSAGQTRAFNTKRAVVCQATFTDGSSGILHTAVP